MLAGPDATMSFVMTTVWITRVIALLLRKVTKMEPAKSTKCTYLRVELSLIVFGCDQR